MLSAAVKTPARLHVLQQERSRREALTEPLVVVLEPLQNATGALRVDVAKRAAEKRGEAQTEDRPDVAVAGRAQDALAQAQHRLIHHLKRAALGHLLPVEALALFPVRQHRVDRAV